jgi:hypothetical protein
MTEQKLYAVWRFECHGIFDNYWQKYFPQADGLTWAEAHKVIDDRPNYFISTNDWRPPDDRAEAGH